MAQAIKKVSLPKGVTAEMIAAFVASQAAEKAAAEKAAKTAEKQSKGKDNGKSGKSEKTYDKPYSERKAERTAEIRAEFPLEFHHCEITGGSETRIAKDGRYAIGAKVDCTWVGANKFLGQSARITFSDGSTGFIDPKFLKAGKPFSDAEKAKAMAEREAETSDTLYIAATISRENDKAVLMEYQGWYAAKWFPKTMVTKTGAMDGDIPIWEIPVWKVRKDIGNDAVAALMAKQDHLTELVNAS